MTKKYKRKQNLVIVFNTCRFLLYQKVEYYIMIFYIFFRIKAVINKIYFELILAQRRISKSF